MNTDVISNIKKVASSVLPAHGSLILFGSRARGDANSDSDWDLLILLDKAKLTKDDYDTVAYPLREVGWEFGQNINPVMYTKKQWESYSFTPFYKNVEHDKLVIVTGTAT